MSSLVGNPEGAMTYSISQVCFLISVGASLTSLVSYTDQILFFFFSEVFVGYRIKLQGGGSGQLCGW